MEKTGTIFTCDECGKQVVDASSVPETPEGWITPQTYTSYDRLSLVVKCYHDDVPVDVSLKKKHFCGTPCLTFHIGKTISGAVASARDAVLEEEATGGEAVNA